MIRKTWLLALARGVQRGFPYARSKEGAQDAYTTSGHPSKGTIGFPSENKLHGNFVPSSKRIAIILTTFSVLFLFLGARLFYFQVIRGKSLASAASAQRVTSSDVDKPRGNFLDRNDIPLTSRNTKHYIVLKPFYLKHNEEDLQKVCSMLNLDFAKLSRELEIRKEPMLFETDSATKNAILEMGIEGISSINALNRYDETTVAKHVLGYLNRVDQVGQTGLEKFFEDTLRVDLESTIGVITDARNNLVQGLGYRLVKLPEDESKLNVKLTLDYHIQRIVEDVMDKNGVTGAVVMEEVFSGDIVAMTSKPDFDQNAVENFLESPENALFNRATASYSPGSIFKIIDAALFYEAGLDPREEFFCPGYIKVGNRELKCASYKEGGHGVVTLTEAFAKSCNPYFIDRGIQIGYQKLISRAQDFGFGETTGIISQGIHEAPGNLPDIKSYHSKGDIANISIGQGEVMATPLQVADMVATIANGGIKNRVNLVDAIIDDKGNKVRSIRVNDGKRIISKEIADKIKELMEEVTVSGTGTKANLDRYGGAGGKTGSAETGREGVVHAWFAGYFPKNDPKYTMAVFIENGQYGGGAAAPIFAEIAEEIMKKGY